MSEAIPRNQKSYGARMATSKTILNSRRGKKNMLSAPALTACLALAVLALTVGCSTELRPKFPAMRQLLTAKFDPAFAEKPVTRKDATGKANSTPETDPKIELASVEGLDSDVALASYQEESPPPTEPLPMPDVPRNFERINALEQQGHSDVRNQSIPPELPPLRPSRDNHGQSASSNRRQTPGSQPAINMQGNILRQPNETATEVSLRQREFIAKLQREIEAGYKQRQELHRLLDDEIKEHKRTDSKLANGINEILRLRKLTAKLQVQVDDLLLENKRIREESEAALRDIESNLDAALHQTIAGKRDD